MMKKALVLCLVLATACACFLTADAAEEGYASSAESWVLYCPDNGEVIASKNADKRMRPASTTKLLTSLIALEQAQKDNKTVTFTREMVAEGSSMYLEIGEAVKLSDLAAGMLMTSGNDAANAAAMGVSGGFEAFSELMNRRAAEIGMKHSHFVTPSGLDDENHYSTAYDMALLMSEALKNKNFAALTAQKRCTVRFEVPRDKQLTYANHNKLLSLYRYCIGGKTGYTTAAGRCLVTAAKKDGLTLICVTMNDRNDWDDHIALYERGFENYAMYSSADSTLAIDEPCVGGDSDSVRVGGEDDAQIVLPADKLKKVSRKIYLDNFLYAPIKRGDAVGRIEYTAGGELLKSVRLIALTDVEARRPGIFDWIGKLFGYG